MKRILSSIELVEVFAQKHQDCEVCATAEAVFDEAQLQLTVELDSFLRVADIRVKEEHQTAGWLPRKQTVKESVSREEALDLAEDIFHRWVGTVRRSRQSPVNH